MELHLIHPALVHFSVAFLVLGAAVEAYGLLLDREREARFGGILVLIGCGSLLTTLVSGYLAANSLAFSPEARDVLAAHERNAWFVLGVFLVAVVWKAWHRGEPPGLQAKLFAVWLLFSAGLVVYSAWLGATMVADLGVGVSSAGTTP